MIHISVIVWALCMLQSVSAFAPEPSKEKTLLGASMGTGVLNSPSTTLSRGLFQGDCCLARTCGCLAKTRSREPQEGGQ